MKMRFHTLGLALALAVVSVRGADTVVAPKENVFANRPLNIRLSVKMTGPYAEATDLQIICLFKHKAAGDTYEGAVKETDAHLKGILSAMRNRGEFVGEAGETVLFKPPQGTIPAKGFLVIGLGEEKDLSLNTLRLAGRVAAREAVRLKAKRAAWAPMIRDQGNTTIEVGEGDRAFVEQMLMAYGTEKRLQAQGLAHEFSLEEFVVEAGPSFFDSAVKHVGEGIEAVMSQRVAAPYAGKAGP
jgi:Cytosol aminopeptidase family, N-terminal domain